jgi:two-component system response regulator AtoC
MRFGDEQVRLSPALVEALCHAHWPGNIRQLENEVARMVALRSGDEIGVEAFSSDRTLVASNGSRSSVAAEPEGELTLPEQVEALERSIIARTMDAVDGNQSEAARRLGLNRGSLILRLKKYGLLGAPMVLHASDRSLASVDPTSSTASAQAAA